LLQSKSEEIEPISFVQQSFVQQPVLPHLRLVQGHPHHLTKTASACALFFAFNQFLSNLWFSVQSSSTWSNSSTAKASMLPDGAYSWVAALVMVMKQSENRAGN
jgi:hypothetical protein